MEKAPVRELIIQFVTPAAARCVVCLILVPNAGTGDIRDRQPFVP